MRRRSINSWKMGVFRTFLCWEAGLVLFTLTAIFCEEDIEIGEVVDDSTVPETWDIQDYQNWEQQEAKTEDELKNVAVNDNSWQMPEEVKDSVLYDVYDKQPEMILEGDEDGVELSDSWIILDQDEEYEEPESQNVFTNNDDGGKNDDLSEESDIHPDSLLLQTDVMECDEGVTEKTVKKQKISAKKRNDDEFYFKHKTYAKKRPKKGPNAVKIPNWKQNCCIRGKRIGNSRRTYLSENIFQECRDRTRNLASRMSRSCKWIFWSCCEAKALRRYYVITNHRRGTAKEVLCENFEK